MSRSKKSLKRIYRYEVVTDAPTCTYLIEGVKEARRTRRMFASCGYAAFARPAFTSPIHNGKKPKK